MRPRARRVCVEAGAALPTILVVVLAAASSAAMFVWYMNRLQSAAGTRLRSVAALGLAESGVHRILGAIEAEGLEATAPDNWRRGIARAVSVGALSGLMTASVADGPGGALLITSAGDVRGAVRRVRATVYPASPLLLAALSGAGTVRFESRPAATAILPYAPAGAPRPWVHVAAGKAVWLGSTDVLLNRSALPHPLGPGPLDTVTAGQTALAAGSEWLRILVARNAQLILAQQGQRLDEQQLRLMGVPVEKVVQHAGELPAPPEIDRQFYSELAAANHANAALNEAAGKHVGDAALARKRDSVYTPAQFARLIAYLLSAPRPLVGVIYVTGGVALHRAERLQVRDGALIAEATVQVSGGASLEVTHSTTTRTLPGIVVLEEGALSVTDGARLRVHGLVYTGRVFAVGTGAWVDIVGSVLAADPVLSFRNFGGAVAIRYDPAVLGTVGLRVPPTSTPVAWVAAWEELP